MYIRKTSISEETGETFEVIKKFEGTVEIQIPPVLTNRHYQEYLEWLAAGNEPEPADD
jgi:hypothetical protein